MKAQGSAVPGAVILAGSRAARPSPTTGEKATAVLELSLLLVQDLQDVYHQWADSQQLVLLDTQKAEIGESVVQGQAEQQQSHLKEALRRTGSKAL